MNERTPSMLGYLNEINSGNQDLVSKFDAGLVSQRHDMNQGLNTSKSIFQRIQVKEEFTKSQSQLGRDVLFTRQRMRSQTPMRDILNPNHSVLLPSLSNLPEKIHNEQSMVFESTFAIEKPQIEQQLSKAQLSLELEVPNKPMSIPSNPYSKSKLSAITPELAANVVRNFILPMFDNDGKKLLKKKKLLQSSKRQRHNSVSDSIDDHHHQQASSLNHDLGDNNEQKHPAPKVNNNSTVYEELKLSQVLQDEIYQLRGKIQVLQEEVQNLDREKGQAIREKAIVEKQNTRNLNIIHMMKSKLKACETETKRYLAENTRMIQQIDQLKELFKYNENSRKQFSEQLQIEKNNNEKLGNQVIDIKQRSSLLRMENDVIVESLQRLYDAMESLGSAKVTEDKYEAKMRDLLDEKQKVVIQVETLSIDIGKLTIEAAEYQTYIKELQSKLAKVQADKDRLQQLFKEKYAQIEKEKDDLKHDLSTKQDELQNLKQQLQQATNEREKLKNKINKMKRRRNVDLNQKICKKCGKEYLENENYNWSCRTHRSEYGGEMWWCCGKQQKDAQGCKFSKHESKDDEEDEKDKEGEGPGNSLTKAQKFKGSKCMCCKAIGHRTEDCDKDPNIRGVGHSVTMENQRLSNRRDYKRYAGDAAEITNKLMEKLSKENKQRDIFGQDIMMFDDYNYAQLNQYIFNQVLETLNSEDDPNGGADIDVLKRSMGKGVNGEVLNEGENMFEEALGAPTQNDSFSNAVQEEAKKLFLGQKILNEQKHKRRLFNEDQIGEILQKQCSDVFEDLIHMRNSNMIENLKIQNMVNLDNFINDMIKVESSKRKFSMRRGTLSVSKYKSEMLSSSLQNSFYKSPQGNNIDRHDGGASDIGGMEYQMSPTGEPLRNVLDRKRSSGQLSGIIAKPFVIQPEPATKAGNEQKKDKEPHQSNSFDYEEQNEPTLLMGFADGQLPQNIAMGIKAFLEKKKEYQSSQIQVQNHLKNFNNVVGDGGGDNERSSFSRESSKIKMKKSEAKIKTIIKNQVNETNNNATEGNSKNGRRLTAVVNLPVESQSKLNQLSQIQISNQPDLQDHPSQSNKRSLKKKLSKEENNVPQDDQKSTKRKSSSITKSVPTSPPIKELKPKKSKSKKPKLEMRQSRKKSNEEDIDSQ